MAMRILWVPGPVPRDRRRPTVTIVPLDYAHWYGKLAESTYRPSPILVPLPACSHWPR
jgi:hypothetical protein